MDDLIHSCQTPKKAIDTIKELDRVLDTGSFKIKEWLSSSKDVLKELTHESVMESCREIPNVKSNSDSPVNLDGEKGVKTLGVGCDPQADVLSFAVIHKDSEIIYLSCQTSAGSMTPWTLHPQSPSKPRLPYKTSGNQTDLNPADDLSQGTAVEDIHGRWETGPDFLKKRPEDWPKDPNPPVVEDPERKASWFLGLVSKVQTIVDSTNYSSWKELTRVTAYILRFIYNVRGASRNAINRRSGPLQPAEIESAEK